MHTEHCSKRLTCTKSFNSHSNGMWYVLLFIHINMWENWSRESPRNSLKPYSHCVFGAKCSNKKQKVPLTQVDSYLFLMLMSQRSLTINLNVIDWLFSHSRWSSATRFNWRIWECGRDVRNELFLGVFLRTPVRRGNSRGFHAQRSWRVIATYTSSF